MKTAFMMFTGIATTGFGMGGIENSITNAELVQGVMVAVVGLMIMAVTVLMINREEA